MHRESAVGDRAKPQQQAAEGGEERDRISHAPPPAPPRARAGVCRSKLPQSEVAGAAVRQRGGKSPQTYDKCDAGPCVTDQAGADQPMADPTGGARRISASSGGPTRRSAAIRRKEGADSRLRETAATAPENRSTYARAGRPESPTHPKGACRISRSGASRAGQEERRGRLAGEASQRPEERGRPKPKAAKDSGRGETKRAARKPTRPIGTASPN